MEQNSVRVLIVFGTRPEAIKMAPLIKTLQRTPGIDPVVCVTGQHQEMLDQVMNDFDMKPDIELSVMRNAQTLPSLTAHLVQVLEPVMQEAYDLVLVHGDTSTAFAAAITAYYAKIPIGHVEAGLRTYDKYAPYPEEMNREWIGRMADIHFAPTPLSAQQLARENRKEHVYVTGNTSIDALRWTLKNNYHHPLLDQIQPESRMIFMTMHRRENWGLPMEQVFGALREIVSNDKTIELVFPVHPNPLVKNLAYEMLGGEERIHLTSPLDVVDMHNLMSRSYLILTDSGGIQEEAPTLGKPVLVLREKTERPEGVKAGTLRCIGTDYERVKKETQILLSNEKKYKKMASARNPYGDGYASDRIAEIILKYFKKQ
ncbi:non-hydrolyzing UDP-N-acetylglucosamine 2-epimerase [Paenibacillus gallinarum]|uniref:UDP-N-acetylglucosamine 2-epimerase (non-hydrolyzing) n=1 Tax=Paenibacillus gallinarum TaxID=2762232 RepID=A0ABR8SUJ8_9BACL|nr:UDP-N-acetylglucosamine 2-epimerase (non-hydrolyzing) [Paenibacillus gallinarum]MBD7967179.1 UDP-N-acetylglucosamine 2-epimerase (non-hydrolyzing) [Paenibacillus gallinarum]